MGFYAPATIVDDAKRHGVRVLPVNVRHSDWDCTLERQADTGPAYALRMGLRYVKGFGEVDWQRIDNARRVPAHSGLWPIVQPVQGCGRTFSTASPKPER